jgi:alpha-D-ribose 1-methylphosphonate 5-triphosphate synthase subunit PhnG
MPSNHEQALSPIQARRQAWLAVLARAQRTELEQMLQPHTDLPPFAVLKAPETGTVMVEGRAGGAGQRFNLGEATVTRCAIRLADGRLGFAYALGRDREKARIAALIDAMLQGEPETGPLHAGIARLADQQGKRREAASRKAAATKVEFFTMVRGEG